MAPTLARPARPFPGRKALDAFLFVAAFVLLWQGAHELAGEQGLASPLATLKRTTALVESAAFWQHAGATGIAFLYALGVALAGGLGIGLLLGYFKLAGDVFEPIVGAIYSIPKITLYPIILLVFGLTLSAKVAFGALHGIFPMIIFTMSGVKTVKPVYLKAARTFGLSPLESIRTILLPAALPEIFTGFRLGFSLTLLGTLIGELFASDRGIGFLLIRGIEHGDAPTIMALTFMLFAVSAFAGWLLLRIDRRLRRYQQAHAATIQ